MNEAIKFELYKAIKVLTESGYLVTEGEILSENRTLDVDEIVHAYIDEISKGIKTKLISMAKQVLSDNNIKFDQTVVISIPEKTIKPTYSNKSVILKPLTFKLYCSKNDIEDFYDTMKGEGKGYIYRGGTADLIPDINPAQLMYNLPLNLSTVMLNPLANCNKAKDHPKKYRSSYSSYGSYGYGYSRSYDDDYEYGGYGRNHSASTTRKTSYPVVTNTASKNSTTSSTNSTTKSTSGYTRNPARDALYARFYKKYNKDNVDESLTERKHYGYDSLQQHTIFDYPAASQYTYKPLTPEERLAKEKAAHQSERDNDKRFDFAIVIRAYKKYYHSANEIADAIMQDLFGNNFIGVLRHELTHFAQANNEAVDGSPNAVDYDADDVFATGTYAADDREIEAELHRHMPEFIDKILAAPDPVAATETIIDSLYKNRTCFTGIEKERQHRFFSEILKFCQLVQRTPGITKDNYNTPKYRKIMNTLL